MEKTLCYVFLALCFIYITLCIVFMIKHLGVEKLRKIAYQGFLLAEKNFNHGDNQAKLDFVVELVKGSAPKVLKPFITKKLLTGIIQSWFNMCKDLLNYETKKEV